MLSMHLPIHLAQVNMGAFNFIAQVNTYALKHKEKGAIIYKKIADCNISGAGLWVLFSELCENDMLTVYLLCENCPDNILIDACSRQDRIGKALVKNYVRPCTEKQLIDIDPNWEKEIDRYKSLFNDEERYQPLDKNQIKYLLGYGSRWAWIVDNPTIISCEIIGYYELQDDQEYSVDLFDMSLKEAKERDADTENARYFDFVFF